MSQITFGYIGTAKVGEEDVTIVRWIRPYGIPYAVLSDKREIHLDSFN